MNEPVTCVIGGGPAGLTSALTLSNQGSKVVLVERTGRLGGKPATFCCKADDVCRWCGVCHVNRMIDTVTKNLHIELCLDSEVAQLQSNDHGFNIQIRSRDGVNREVACDYLVWAGGYQLFDASLKPAYGYGRYPNVVTSIELDQMLLEKDLPIRHSDNRSPRSFAFIQCTGSRDIRLGADYCSQVCCASSVRLANLLKYRCRECDVSIFRMDVQSPNRPFDLLLSELDISIKFIDALPGEVLPLSNGNLLLNYPNASTSTTESLEVEMVVLAIGIRPQIIPQIILETLNLKTTGSGFLNSVSDSSRVAVAGTATGPMSIANTMIHARSAVNLMWARTHGVRL
ncbi:CoB--CoM heterodisulfide reductase iron-sulfur subunit A family protein [bacterium]|nr:CoB--CoM heterodisulfide reductase iron-sulfur subunit A family protein [candidate division CSSED10-310 bacterium]